MKLTAKQKKLASKLWIAALIESTGDSFVDESGIWKIINIEQVEKIHDYSKKIAKQLRKEHPPLLIMQDIIKYVSKIKY